MSAADLPPLPTLPDPPTLADVASAMRELGQQAVLLGTAVAELGGLVAALADVAEVLAPEDDW